MMYGVVAMGLLLVALALGYLVLTLAKKEELPFKILGYCIAVIIISVSTSFVVTQTVESFVLSSSAFRLKGRLFKKHLIIKPQMPMPAKAQLPSQ